MWCRLDPFRGQQVLATLVLSIVPNELLLPWNYIHWWPCYILGYPYKDLGTRFDTMGRWTYLSICDRIRLKSFKPLGHNTRLKCRLVIIISMLFRLAWYITPTSDMQLLGTKTFKNLRLLIEERLKQANHWTIGTYAGTLPSTRNNISVRITEYRFLFHHNGRFVLFPVSSHINRVLVA